MNNGHEKSNIVWFEHLGRSDVATVGGKTASRGEMVQNLGQ
jgi:phosphoenolpyruvate synthase/pyruvate phosphate dikinase